MNLPIFETVLNGITVVGSIVGTRLDLARGVRAARCRQTRVVLEQRPLEEVNEAIDEVERGDVTARIVLRP